MRKIYVMILIMIILSPIIGCCQSNDESISDTPKTGDIMVVARGCTLPPYEFGLKLELNLMRLDIPEWIRETPGSSLENHSWVDSALIVLGKEGPAILNYIYDSLHLKSHLVHDAYIYSDHCHAIGITLVHTGTPHEMWVSFIYPAISILSNTSPHPA